MEQTNFPSGLQWIQKTDQPMLSFTTGAMTLATAPKRSRSRARPTAAHPSRIMRGPRSRSTRQACFWAIIPDWLHLTDACTACGLKNLPSRHRKQPQADHRSILQPSEVPTIRGDKAQLSRLEWRTSADLEIL